MLPAAATRRLTVLFTIASSLFGNSPSSSSLPLTMGDGATGYASLAGVDAAGGVGLTEVKEALFPFMRCVFIFSNYC